MKAKFGERVSFAILIEKESPCEKLLVGLHGVLRLEHYSFLFSQIVVHILACRIGLTGIPEAFIISQLNMANMSR